MGKLKQIKLLKKFLVGNLKDYQILLLLFFINLIFFYVFYSSVMIFSDSSREIYVPIAMNNGDVLYKDIFNVYAPLGYQLNAFLIKVFGENLRTFYFAGFINSTLILFGLFYILKLFIKKGSILVFSILLAIMTMCIYTVTQTNYIFPYSYSLVYALNSFIWSLICLLCFIKNDNRLFLYLSFFFYGMSICFKYEFIPFGIVLFLFLIFKKVNFKTVALCILSFLIIPFISLSFLFIQGVSFYDLKQAMIYMIMLSKAKSVKILYTYLGFIPTISSIEVLLLYFIQTTLFVFVISLYVCFFIKFSKLFLRINKIIMFILFILYLLLFYFFISIVVKNLVISNAFYFNWIGVFSLILFFVLCINLVKKHKEKTVCIQDILFFTLFLSVILCSLKCIFNISFNSYGTYYFPLLFICSVLYLYIYKINLAERIKIKKLIYIQLITILIFLIGTMYYVSNVEKLKIVYGFRSVNVDKGPLMPGLEQIESIYDTVNYIQNNTNKDDTILVLPEGAAINFLTNRKSNNKYYYLIPPNIEIFGEENIVKDLENDLPDYIVIQPMSYINFKETFFCESFGLKICNIIPKYYKKPVVFGNDFWIAVYERKNNDEE